MTKRTKDAQEPTPAMPPRVRIDSAAWCGLDADAEGWLKAVEAHVRSDQRDDGDADRPGEDLRAGETAFLLMHREGRFELRPPGEHDRPGIFASVPADARDRRNPSRSARRAPLLRAIGSRTRRVIDATAGLGGDTSRLAVAGWPVLACERDPVVFALLASGWRAACDRGDLAQDVAARVALCRSDAREQVEASDEEDLAVFVDPMYPPPRRASAKPRRELQVLRGWLGHGAGVALTEAAALVERAREKAARVVVKRPHHASPLVAGPSFEIESKLVRFDVYVNPARMARADEEGAG